MDYSAFPLPYLGQLTLDINLASQKEVTLLREQLFCSFFLPHPAGDKFFTALLLKSIVTSTNREYRCAGTNTRTSADQ